MPTKPSVTIKQRKKTQHIPILFLTAHYRENEHVVLTVESATAAEEAIVDHEFIAYCETQADDAVSLEQVREALASIPGSLVKDIRDERDER